MSGIWDQLTPLRFGHPTLAKPGFPTPKQAESPWAGPGPGPVPRCRRSCPLTWCPSSCFRLGNNFPCTFPPSTVPSVHPLGTDSVPEGLCPLLPNSAGINKSGAEKLHFSQTPWGRLKGLKKVTRNTSSQLY